MKRILILGGSGFLGSHLCEKLSRLNYAVTVPTRRAVNARHLQMLPLLQIAECDIHDEKTLMQLLPGHDAVVNLVAILHGNQASFERTHVDLPEKVARACLACDVKRLVHVSALGADGRQPQEAPSMYLRSKGRGESVLHAAIEQGLKLTVLQPSVIFGADDKFTNLFAKLQRIAPFLPLAGAESRFQPVWVEDVAQAILNCLHTPATEGMTYELCGPEIFSLREIAQLAARLSGINGGKGRPIFDLPIALAYFQARLMELLPGVPLMSCDNLESMRMDNIASGTLPGLKALGIESASLAGIASTYLRSST